MIEERTTTTPVTAATFGGHLRALRLARGLSKVGMARAAGTHHSTISRLEADTRHPERDTVLRLAAVLDASDAERGHLLWSANYWPDAPGIALAIATWEVAAQEATDDCEVMPMD